MQQSPENILTEIPHLENHATEMLKLAKKFGASDAEVYASLQVGFSTTVRMGSVETVEHNRDKGITVTVYFGQCKGSASTSDISATSIEETIRAACNIAKYTGIDLHAGLADKTLLASDYKDLDLYHPWNVTPAQAVVIAQQCEDKARAYDPRITNSEGASVSTHQGISVYANSNDFIGKISGTSHSINCTLIAESANGKQRDHSYTVARDPLDLWSTTKVAEDAASRTIRRLNARRLPTQTTPVIFAAELARGLIASFISAISGGHLYRKTTFLVDHLGKKIFPDFITIREHPHWLKAYGSSPFDNEGVRTRENVFIDKGILTNYVLSSYSARKLGMQTTGNAGGVHNLTITNGNEDLKALFKKMGKGLYVTEVMGQGVNLITGDYSRGAAGFWIEDGEMQFPVEEITIAGNLKDMYANMVAVANDIDDRGNVHTGSILLPEMMIAGI